jgi:hypothetical protein
MYWHCVGFVLDGRKEQMVQLPKGERNGGGIGGFRALVLEIDH